MRVYNETTYDKEMVLRYNRYYLIDFFKKNYSIIAVAGLAGAIYSFVINEWITALMLIGFVLLYAGLTVLIQKASQNRALKKSPIVNNPIVRTYLFEDEEISISGRFVDPAKQEAGTTPKQRTIRYEEIERITSYKDFLMIYDMNRHSYLVDLTHFENPGDFEVLKHHLISKIGKRYR